MSTHSGAKKAHDWVVDQIVDLFRTTHKVKTQQVVKSRGQHCDPNLNDNLHYPNDKDRSLNESTTNKIRKYRSDYNNSPPNTISFMPPMASTSGRLHNEFVRLLFLQTHRETIICRNSSSPCNPVYERSVILSVSF